MADPRFVRNRITGILYDFNPLALKRSENDFEPFDGPLDDDGAAIIETPDRLQLILDAVKTIAVSDYSAAAGGRPPMPKVAAIIAIVGFKVSADEVAAAVNTLNAAPAEPAAAPTE